MSLVLAIADGDRQWWCCDGRTMAADGDRLVVVNDDVTKIVPVHGGNVLFGWAGDRRDAELIAAETFARGFGCSDELLECLAGVCSRSNQRAVSQAASGGEPYCPTGVMAGGRIGAEGFLAVVMPDGEVRRNCRFATIGAGSADAARLMLEYGLQRAEAGDAARVCREIVEQVARIEPSVGGILFEHSVAAGWATAAS